MTRRIEKAAGDILAKRNGIHELPGCGSDCDRASTGIDYLDGIIQGGFLRGRTYLVGGAPGTGKSIFALQFLRAGLARGENGLFVCVNEKPEDVIFTAKSLGWDLEPAVSAGKILFLDMSPFFSRSAVVNHNRYERRGTDVNIRKFLIDLDKYARAHSAQRLIIDSVNLILPGTQETRAATSARELVISIEQYLSCTSLLTFDYWRGRGQGQVHPLESYVSGVINLALVERAGHFVRTVWLKKARATAAGSEVHKFVIRPDAGITVSGDLGGNGHGYARGGNGDRKKAVEAVTETRNEPDAVLMKE